jgi:hypothetical protein
VAYNAADPQQVKKRQREADEAKAQNAADLAMLLKIPEFRRYLWRLIGTRCQVLQSPFESNGSLMNLKVGRSDVGRELWAEIESIDPLAIPQMMREFHESQRVDE